MKHAVVWYVIGIILVYAPITYIAVSDGETAQAIVMALFGAAFIGAAIELHRRNV